MDFDFALILTELTALAGLIWLFDVVFLKPRRKAATQATLGKLKAESHEELAPETVEKVKATGMRESLLVEYAHSFFPVLAVVWVLRSFLVEPFTIPSGSMLPTLEVGDYILVNKFSYGLRLPVVGTKIVSLGDPQRGDIMVFKYPEDPKVNFIKRVVGLPGDRIAVDGNKVFINGKLLDKTLVSEEPAFNPWQRYYSEQLGTHKHAVRELIGSVGGPSVELVVPQGHYFMLGDNRNESKDSRYWGTVPDKNIVGKAFFIWVHKKPGLNLPTFGRNGKVD